MNEIESFENEKKRISAEYNSLSEYLVFDENTKTYIDTLDIMKNSDNMMTFLDSYLDRLVDVDLKTLVAVYMAVNSKKKEDIIPIIEKKYKTRLGSGVIFDRLVQTKKKDLPKLIAANKAVSARETKNMKKYDILVNREQLFDEFKEEFIEYTLIMEFEEQTPLELFDSVILTSDIPFVACSNFYKILKDYSNPSLEWINETDPNDILVIRTSDNREITVKVKPGELEITFYLNIKKHTFEVEKNNILAIFSSGEMRIKQIIEKKKGTFVLNIKTDFNQYILADIIMNNPIFNSVFYIDDHKNTTKERNILHLKTDRIGEKNIITLIQDNSRVKVRFSKGVLNENIQKIQNIFNALFNLYDDEFDDLKTEYESYGAQLTFESKKSQPVISKKPLSELFIGGYSRFCSVIPEFTESEEHALANAKGNVIRFPRDYVNNEDEDISSNFQSDGKDQYYFFSTNEKYPYVGIKKNTLKNADDFPYAPCCYQTDPKSMKDFLIYYRNSDENTENTKSSNSIIKGRQFVPVGKLGLMPDKIDTLLTFLISKINIQFIKRGVDISSSSFLQCVLEGVHEQSVIVDEKNRPIGGKDTDPILSKNPKKRLEFVLNERLKLVDDIRKLAVCKQEMYDNTITEIADKIKDEETYLDPSLFIHLLEEVYDCNIILFRESGFLIPRHTKNYCKNVKKRKTLCIFENTYNQKKLPQCELIVKYDQTKSEDNIDTFFMYRESQQIIEYETKLYHRYSLDYKNFVPVLYDFSRSMVDNIQSQYIDCFGKTRVLNIRVGSFMCSVKTEPLQPFYIDQIEEEIGKLKNPDEVNEVVSMLNIKLTKQHVFNGKTIELFGTIDHIQISIETENIDILPNIKTHKVYNSTKNIKDPFSNLEIYNNYKKTARYITECTKWLFSKNLDLGVFAQSGFTIRPDYSYMNIPITFQDNPVFDNSDEETKIIVTSDDMKKRLVYILKLGVIRDKDTIENYSRLHTKHIPNYYEDLTDFNSHPKQLILFKRDSILNITQNTDFVIHSTFQIQQTQPYFYKNNKKVYLAQNTTDVKKAVEICNMWKKHKFNSGFFSKDSSDEIVPELVIPRGNKKLNFPDKSKKIVQYETPDVVYFICLLTV